jgi:hypothetical protein
MLPVRLVVQHPNVVLRYACLCALQGCFCAKHCKWVVIVHVLYTVIDSYRTALYLLM